MTKHSALESSDTRKLAAAGQVSLVLAGIALVCASAQAFTPGLGERGARLALVLSGFTAALAAGAACIAAWTCRRCRTVIAEQATEAQNLGQRKDAFLAGLSHELRTPLNVVVGYAGLLLDESIGTLVPTQQDIVTRITMNARNLSNMINDLVDVSRIEAGRVELEIAPVEIQPLFAELTHVAEIMKPESTVAFAWTIAPGCPRVLADATRLHQVLSNLVVNAVKFTEQGSIGLRAAPDGRGRVLISVADTGMGIPEDMQEALFDPARRAPDTRHSIPGSGIGLSIAAKLAGLMGAELSVTSDPGRGTCFTLALPAKESDLADEFDTAPVHADA